MNTFNAHFDGLGLDREKTRMKVVIPRVKLCVLMWPWMV